MTTPFGGIACVAMSACLIPGVAAPIDAKIEAPTFALGETRAWVTKHNSDPDRPNNFTVEATNPNGELITVNRARTIVRIYPKTNPLQAKWYRYSESALEHRGEFYHDDAPRGLLFEFPLFIGKTWHYRPEAYKGKGGDLIQDQLNGKVTGIETVNVRAGQFEAYKISMNGWWLNLSFLQANVKGRLTHELWYAPKAKAVVLHKIVSYDWKSGLPNSTFTLEVTNVKGSD